MTLHLIQSHQGRRHTDERNSKDACATALNEKVELNKPFEKFRRWLQGSFTCRKCGKNYYIMTFGYGEGICPDCYEGEQPFLFFDNTYWLNRITSHLLNLREKNGTTGTNDMK